MLITFERLETWPETPVADRKSAARFQATYPTIKADLENEIARIEGYNVLLEADIIPQGIGKSGWPYAGTNAKSHPGVRVSFTVNIKGTPTRLEFACDEYDGWLANLRGISLTLSALRDIKRHGATRNQQQYAGFRKALPAGGGTAAHSARSHHSDLPQPEQTGLWGPQYATYAADLLVGACIKAGKSFDPAAVRSDTVTAQMAYRCAAKYFHPDSSTGDEILFVRIGQAIETLRQLQTK